MQFTQKSKTYNHQALLKYACTWGKNKNSEIKEMNTLTKLLEKCFSYSLSRLLFTTYIIIL